MRIVAAPDSFKESIAAVDICELLAPIFKDAGHEFISIPLADGGEGTVDAVLAAVPGERILLRVEGPLGREVEAAYALVDQGRTAIVEMAAASGLQLAPAGDRDPMRASTYGTGQLIRDAIERGARKIIVGLGGSATTDGGAGAAEALGIELRDSAGQVIPRGGIGLRQAVAIKADAAASLLDGVEMIAACDVDNPLVGDHGAARIYAPQKGATAEQVEELEASLKHYAALTERENGAAIANLPGAGAAGGFAGGLVALCGARIESGFGLLAEIAGLDAAIADADAVITGEGKIDSQTFRGKTVAGVCELALKHGVPVHVIAGMVEIPQEELHAVGIHSAVGLAEFTPTPEVARSNPRPFLQWIARNLAQALAEE